MKLSRPILAAVTVGLVLAVVFAVFAVELAGGQARSRNQIKTEVQDRAILTASLVNSLFGTLEVGNGQDTASYGGPVVDMGKLEAAAQGERYALVADRSGRVIAATGGFGGRSGLTVPISVLDRLASGASTYYLGDLYGSGASFTSELLVPFAAQDHSVRFLVTGLNPASPTFALFFGSNLRTVPGVSGEVNYYVDGNGRVIASSDSRVQPGSFPTHLSAGSLRGVSGEEHGWFHQEASLHNSNWRVLLVAPSSALFSSVNGTRALLPWIIFAALVAAALVAGLLGWRVLRAAEVVTEVNAKLASVNAELSAANDALERRAAELARSNEELESFASIASHDLQEPLRKVRTFTEQLTIIEADRLSDKGRDYLGRANDAAERMQRLIEDLLKFSRVSTQGRPFERVDLAEVARRVLYDLENQIDEAGAVVDVGPLPTIAADPLQMQQLLQNLISNAIKFRRPDVPSEVRVRASVNNGKLKLTVSDNGIGFEPRYSARIFRIFERLHGRTEYPGTGIGLALCRKIADRHGGSIEAESELGHGATFTATLPVDHPDAVLDYRDGSAQYREVVAGAGI